MFCENAFISCSGLCVEANNNNIPIDGLITSKGISGSLESRGSCRRQGRFYRNKEEGILTWGVEEGKKLLPKPFILFLVSLFLCVYNWCQENLQNGPPLFFFCWYQENLQNLFFSGLITGPLVGSARPRAAAAGMDGWMDGWVNTSNSRKCGTIILAPLFFAASFFAIQIGRRVVGPFRRRGWRSWNGNCWCSCSLSAWIAESCQHQDDWNRA